MPPTGHPCQHEASLGRVEKATMRNARQRSDHLLMNLRADEVYFGTLLHRYAPVGLKKYSEVSLMPVPETDVAKFGPGVPSWRPIEGPSAWIGADMREREAEWTYRLSPLELAEIETALRVAHARGLDIAEIRREDFPLPTLGPVLDRLRAEVLDGRGFGLLRGMPVEDRPIAESAMAYWGLALILGARVRKTRKGICWGMSTTSAKASARPILICGAMRPQNGRISTLIAATSLRSCVCGEQSRAGYRPSSVQ